MVAPRHRFVHAVMKIKEKEDGLWRPIHNRCMAAAEFFLYMVVEKKWIWYWLVLYNPQGDVCENQMHVLEKKYKLTWLLIIYIWWRFENAYVMIWHHVRWSKLAFICLQIPSLVACRFVFMGPTRSKFLGRASCLYTRISLTQI